MGDSTFIRYDTVVKECLQSMELEHERYYTPYGSEYTLFSEDDKIGYIDVSNEGVKFRPSIPFKKDVGMVNRSDLNVKRNRLVKCFTDAKNTIEYAIKREFDKEPVDDEAHPTAEELTEQVTQKHQSPPTPLRNRWRGGTSGRLTKNSCSGKIAVK